MMEGGNTNPRGQRRFRSDYDPEEYAPRRKLTGQRPVDLYSPAIRHVTTRLLPRRTRYNYHVNPHEYYTKDLLPARHTSFNPATALCTQWANTSFHPDTRGPGEARVPLYGLRWAPNGRRLLCTTSRGEFLLFNGRSFGLEVKTVAHEDSRPCRAVAWGAHSDIILSGDDAGRLKMWLSNFVFVAEVETGHRAIREISWAPQDAKFSTAGQDGTARVWDTSSVGQGGPQTREEVKLEGHGGDVTTVDWHPFRSVIATGSQDTQCRLWDPRTGTRGSIAALCGHSQPITRVRWHPTDGRTLLSASKDASVKLWDVRMAQSELIRFKSHTESVESIEWHPSATDLFVSAGADGSIMHWMVKESDGTLVHGVQESIKNETVTEAAHGSFRDTPNTVNALAWSPMGNILASCGNEVKYWVRNRPGAMEERERGMETDVLLEEGDGAAGLL